MAEIDSKIARLNKLLVRISIWIGGLFLLLVLSLRGVQLEISVIGVKLEKLQDIKEIILIFAIASTTYVEPKIVALRELKALKKQIFIRRYGEKNFEVLERTFPYELDAKEILRTFNHKKYDAIGIKRWIDFLRLTVLFGCALLGLAAFTWLYWFVVIDIWKNPTIDPFWAKLISGFAGYNYFVALICVFRGHPAGDSDNIRHPIPNLSGT